MRSICENETFNLCYTTCFLTQNSNFARFFRPIRFKLNESLKLFVTQKQCLKLVTHTEIVELLTRRVLLRRSRQVQVWEVVFAVLERIVLHLFRIVVPIRQSTTFRRVAATTAMHQVLVHL